MVKELRCNFFVSHAAGFYILGTVIKNVLSYETKFNFFSQFKAVAFAWRVFGTNKLYYTLLSLLNLQMLDDSAVRKQNVTLT